MTPEFYAYKTFLAIKNHFKNPDYDYFFYNGRVTAKEESFRGNKNYHQFVALSRKVKSQDIPNFLACNFAYAKKTLWVTHLAEREAHETYEAFQAYYESMSYRFGEDLKKIWPLDLSVSRGTYPKLIIDVMSGKVRMETLCILDALYEGKLTATFDQLITEPYLWPSFRMRYTKFTPFLKISLPDLKIVLDKQTETK